MPQQIIAQQAAIATGHPLGAAAGEQVLRDGGNAIDAAVAATLALCVVIPGSVGLGGYGGSAIVRCGDGDDRFAANRGRVVAIDFDSRAPLAFREGLVTVEPQSSLFGARSVTVPAIAAGLDLLLREFGTISWAEVSRPAIHLAKEGFAFDDEHERNLQKCLPQFDRQSVATLFPEGVPSVGGRWRQPALARLLQRLAEDGPAVFYEGPVAQSIVKYLADRDGILHEDDFREYRPQMVTPACATCRDCELYTPPPPSGGINTLGIVETIEQLLDAERVFRGSARFYKYLASAMELCWHERQRLGDPEFIDFDWRAMLGQSAARERAERIRQLPHAASSTPHSDAPAQSAHTANVIAIDAAGNLISLTATQGWMYGAHLVVDELGLVLNHGMSRFEYSRGHANAPAPAKRMQHNMVPLIALRAGKPAFAFGMPGGPKIVSVTAQLAIDTIHFGATPAAAVAAPRVHTTGGWAPVLVSTHLPIGVVTELEHAGHVVQRDVDMGGPVNVLSVDSVSGGIDIASGEQTGAVAGF